MPVSGGTLKISEKENCWSVSFDGGESGPSWSFPCSIYNLLMVLGGLNYYIAGADGTCELRREGDVIRITSLFGNHINAMDIPLAEYERIIKTLSFSRGDVFLT